MANIDQTEATLLLKALLNNTAYTLPTTWYVALDTSTTAPTATGFGSEVTAGGYSYARQAIAWTTAAAGATASSNAQTYTNMPAVSTVSSIEIFTTSTGTTRRLLYGALTAAKTTAAGDTLTLSTGAVTMSLG